MGTNRIEGRSMAESFGNHSSNDVLAANVAKSIIYDNDLVTPTFLSHLTSEGVHPVDFNLFKERVNGHITDILYNNPQIETDKGYIGAALGKLFSRVNVSPEAVKGAFLSPDDCPDDRGKWFLYEDGKAVQSSYRNAAEDPKIPYGEKWVGCLTGQEFQDMMELKSLLVQQFTFGNDFLDEACFYRLSKNLSEPVMDVFRKIVSAESKQYCKEVREAVGGYAKLDNKRVDEEVKHWFHPWTRLAGRMEDAIFYDSTHWDKDTDGLLYFVGDLSAILDSFSKLPEYQPYLEKEFKVFAAECCEDLRLNYLDLPEKFRNPECERTFIKNHPELVNGFDKKNIRRTKSARIYKTLVSAGCSNVQGLKKK